MGIEGRPLRQNGCQKRMETQRAKEVAKTRKFAVFLGNSTTGCQFFWLARWGGEGSKCLTFALFWQRAKCTPWRAGSPLQKPLFDVGEGRLAGLAGFLTNRRRDFQSVLGFLGKGDGLKIRPTGPCAAFVWVVRNPRHSCVLNITLVSGLLGDHRLQGFPSGELGWGKRCGTADS
jgi:hypothetical protein